MKKNLTCVLIILAMLCTMAVGETIKVSISNGSGEIVLAAKEINVSDADNDGSITIYDALFTAHETAYEGGAADGFAVGDSDYGLSLTRLWGEENGGSYGYYLNNNSAYSLTDPVTDGDSVYAFVYRDLAAWSDTYCFFETDAISCAAGEEFELTLNMIAYDAAWNKILLPVEGASIVANGADCAVKTNTEGKAILSLPESGEYLISAVSETMTLVPPVCIAKIG